MARIHIVEKATKDNGVCELCGAELLKGSPYQWVSVKTGNSSSVKKKRCAACPTWRRSETTSSKMAGAYAAQETFEDFFVDWDATEGIESVAIAMQIAADSIGEVADAYEESAQNIIDGFGHDVPMSEELQEKADAIRDWAEEIIGSIDDLPETEDCKACESGSQPCPMCEGTGTFTDGLGLTKKCPSCHGEALIVCLRCQGRGYDIEAFRGAVEEVCTVIFEEP